MRRAAIYYKELLAGNINFTFVNNSANLVFKLPASYGDATFGNILPRVKRLAVAKVQFSKAFSGQNEGAREDLTFRE